MKMHRFIYLPLGGAGEIGMNAYVYGYGEVNKERLIIVDLGVAFPNLEGTPGVDLILPDISWLEKRRDRVEALFITHAHEDHIGAIGYLWEKFEVPIYARNFTAHIARRKMLENDLSDALVRTVSTWPDKVKAGPFEVSFVPVSHSIPESSALTISCPSGRVIHTGDFKLDKTPVVGEPFDLNFWREIVKDQVHALICDSTNVLSTNKARSEGSLKDNITSLIAQAPKMVIATTFASNIARLKTLAEAGQSVGRSICIMGRAMRRMIETALETGVLKDFPKVVSSEEAGSIPREHLMLLVTGSQGERRAASAQLSAGKFQGIEIKERDLFLFSSKTIPGNERGVIRVINQLAQKGVDVVDDSSGLYHASGHANRCDLSFIHRLVQPKIIIPMHGGHRHLLAHSKLAEENGKVSLVCVDGMMLELSGKVPEVIDKVETGRIYLDGKVQYGAYDGVVRDRIRVATNGFVSVTIVKNGEDITFGEPLVKIRGLPKVGTSNVLLEDILEEDLMQFIGRADIKTLRNDENLETGIVRATRQSCLSEIGKRPEVSVTITHLI